VRASFRWSLIDLGGTCGRPFTYLAEWYRRRRAVKRTRYLRSPDDTPGHGASSMLPLNRRVERGAGTGAQSHAADCSSPGRGELTTSSSAFLDADERPSRTSQPQSRTKIR
jgi:hypothetical protein